MKSMDDADLEISDHYANVLECAECNYRWLPRTLKAKCCPRCGIFLSLEKAVTGLMYALCITSCHDDIWTTILKF
jgi:Zn finger protein HypA/HybF involved in hydrogenase expression